MKKSGKSRLGQILLMLSGLVCTSPVVAQTVAVARPDVVAQPDTVARTDTVAQTVALTREKNGSKFADQFVVADGVKLHYVRGGSGPTLVLLHGNDGTLLDFTMSIFDKLSQKYEVIAFDRPGHGQSETPKGTIATPELQARLIHSALAKIGMSRPLIVAHSWSGALALSYALQFPNDYSGVVLLGGMAYSTKEGAAKPIYRVVQVPVLGSAVALSFKLAGRREIQGELEQAFSPDKAPKPYMEKFMSNLFRTSQLKAAAQDEITLNPCLEKMSADYGKIDKPVIIVCGDLDKTVPAKLHSFRLHEAIPDSELIVVQHAGHELQFTRPDDVIRAIDLAATKSLAIRVTRPIRTAGKSAVQ